MAREETVKVWAGSRERGGLFEGAPSQFNVILTNPPFGGEESVTAQTGFD